MDPTRRVALWLAPGQTALFREIASAAELSVVAAGSPVRGQSGGVAGDLGCAAVDDLRTLLAGVEADLVVIAAPDTFGAAPNPDDADLIRGTQSRGMKIAALEPIPGAALDLLGGGWLGEPAVLRPVDAIRFCPLLRLSRPFRDAAEMLENFGHVRMLSLEGWCRPCEGSLGAQLYSCLDLVLWLFGEPETIDAAYIAPDHGKGVHALPGETLSGLHGDLTANLRFADGRAAAIVASDHGGRWNRTATLAGPGGRLRMYDDGFEWISPEGKKLDESRTTVRGAGGDGHFIAAIADTLTRLMDPAIPDPGPPDHVTLLAMAQAALLSARTGQNESPSTIKRMAGAV